MVVVVVVIVVVIVVAVLNVLWLYSPTQKSPPKENIPPDSHSYIWRFILPQKENKDIFIFKTCAAEVTVTLSIHFRPYRQQMMMMTMIINKNILHKAAISFSLSEYSYCTHY